MINYFLFVVMFLVIVESIASALSKIFNFSKAEVLSMMALAISVTALVGVML